MSIHYWKPVGFSFTSQVAWCSWLWMVKDTLELWSKTSHTFFFTQKCLSPFSPFSCYPLLAQDRLVWPPSPRSWDQLCLGPGQILFIFPMLTAWLSSVLLPKSQRLPQLSLKHQSLSQVVPTSGCGEPAWQVPKPLLASQQSSDPH